jgi:hypothetical protein
MIGHLIAIRELHEQKYEELEFKVSVDGSITTLAEISNLDQPRWYFPFNLDSSRKLDVLCLVS